MAQVPACQVALARYSRIPEWAALRDRDHDRAGTARVYQVGPREQVQQVSTVARSANSMALAASLAASAPSAGGAASATAGFSRQAMGRATALERAPLVVGYSDGTSATFGWVIGPRALLDAKGRVTMEQVSKTYDVWADLTVPGWWSGFDLEVTSIWAPAPDGIASGNLRLPQGAASPRQHVDIIHTSADYDALTDFILGNRDRRVRIRDVQGGPVNACRDTTLWISGDNLWRAQSVFVLGTLIKREHITIAPDMRGIFVVVPAITSLPNVNTSRTLAVLTPVGTDTWTDANIYLAEPSGDACTTPKAQASAAPNAASIDPVSTPLEFVVPSKFQIRVSGTNLKKIARVELHGQAGTVNVQADGKALTVDFDETSTSSIPASDNTALVFFDADKKVVATLRVRTPRAN